MDFLVIAIISNIVLSGIVAYAANQRGRSGAAFFILSFFLSFIVGILVVMALPAQPIEVTMSTSGTVRVPCPHCQEQILAAANVCKHCGRDVEPNTAALNAAAEGVVEQEQASYRTRRSAGILQGAFIILAALILAVSWPDLLVLWAVVAALGIFWLVRGLRVPKVEPVRDSAAADVGR